jgi:hypothetical protein
MRNPFKENLSKKWHRSLASSEGLVLRCVFFNAADTFVVEECGEDDLLRGNLPARGPFRRRSS